MEIGPETPRGQALTQVRSAFRAAGLDEAALDARVLLLGALDISATEFALRPDKDIGEEGSARLRDFAARRLAGEPVFRILGEREFWGLPFRLSPGTLSPRPDSETLVAAALDHLPPGPRRVLDLGCGSGCLLVALLHEREHVFGIGVDRSRNAAATARGNAARNGVEDRSAFLVADWADALTGPFDAVISNPPYIPTAEIPALAREVREHDPLAALDGGEDGLEAYRAIVAQAPRLLAPRALLAFEIGATQAAAVVALGEAAGLTHVETRRDLADLDRVVVLRNEKGDGPCG
jgi:release factor glutamine methyltransferase